MENTSITILNMENLVLYMIKPDNSNVMKSEKINDHFSEEEKSKIKEVYDMIVAKLDT
jgi:hypothetical protein